MRYMEQCADWPAHSMHHRHGCIIKRNACLQSRRRHLNSGFHILSVAEGSRQIPENPFYRRNRKHV